MDLVETSLLKASGLMIAVLLIGVLAGMAMDEARTGYLKEEIRDTELQTETFVVTQKYLEDSSRNYCGVMESKLPEISDKNAQIGRNLQAFSGKSIWKKQDYKYLKEKYYVNQLRLYMMLKDYKERCNVRSNLVLFFFDSSIASKRQGAVLTEYRRKVDNRTHIFSYNLESKNSEVLDMLEADFNVSEGPVMVINGDNIYRNYTSLKELEEVMNSSNDTSS